MEPIIEYSNETIARSNHALRGSLNMIQRKRKMLDVIKGN